VPYHVIPYCTVSYCILPCSNSPCRVVTPSSHVISSLLTTSNPFSSLLSLPYLLTGIGGSSSGGAAVAGILGFMGGYPDPLASEGFLYSQRLAEAYKHVFAVRYIYPTTVSS
jgi:hypothetical protein